MSLQSGPYSIIKNSYVNYIEVLAKLLIGLPTIEVIFRFNNKKMILKNYQVRNFAIAYNLKMMDDADPAFFPEIDLMEFTYNGKRYRFYGFLENGWIYKQFVDFEYNNMSIKDKIIIDVGANVGDTSLVFAVKGAKHVYAIEPMSLAYTLLKKNIDENGFTSVITPINAGISDIEGEIVLRKDYSTLGTSLISARVDKAELGKVVRLTTIRNIIFNYNLKNCSLKMDCEGCEYRALLNTDDETLTHIDEILLEYHHGYKQIYNFLVSKGFKVNYYPNKVKGILKFLKRHRDTGFIHAIKWSY